MNLVIVHFVNVSALPAFSWKMVVTAASFFIRSSFMRNHLMSNKISLIKPVSDGIYSALDESQIRFFATIGINFCLGIEVSSFVMLKTQYESVRKSSALADDK